MGKFLRLALVLVTAAALLPQAICQFNAAAAAAVIACPNGYKVVRLGDQQQPGQPVVGQLEQLGSSGSTAGTGCECSPGFGSYVLSWTGSQYPSTPPSCSYHIPGKSSSDCSCFKCPKGYSSRGGRLNSRAAACTAVDEASTDAADASSEAAAPVRSLLEAAAAAAGKNLKLYVLLKVRTSVSLCNNQGLKNTAVKAVVAGFTGTKEGFLPSPAGTVASCHEVSRTESPAGKTVVNYKLVVQLTYSGKITTRSKAIANIKADKQKAICDVYKVCDAIRQASQATMVYGALASAKPFAVPSVDPADICSSAPTNSTPAGSTGWAAGCPGTRVGSSCTAPCATGATGTGYTAQCTAKETWSAPNGSCVVPACANAPASSLNISQYTNGWNTSCASSAVGTICTAACKAGFSGGGFSTTCTAQDTWAIESGSCTQLTCPGAPTASTPVNAQAWNSSCTGAAWGAVCTTACTSAATGGYTATCANGTWQVTGNCTLKTCTNQPPASSASNSVGFNCSTLSVGQVCTAACAASSTSVGYTATCTDANTWNITGSCALKSCPTAPAQTLALNSVGWNTTTCANVTFGSTCAAPCLANATGTTYTATCNGTGIWSVAGNCTLKSCPAAPAASLVPNSVGFNASTCNATASGGTCRALCSSSALGTGYTATCNAGTWNITGNCTLKVCSAPPANTTAPNSVGWNTTACANTTYGGTCRANCASNSAGTPYVATCNNTNVWTVTGSCSLKACPTLPTNTSLAFSPGWPNAVNGTGPTCLGTLPGGICTAPCGANATGSGYSSTCNGGVWTNVTGFCQSKVCMGLPMSQTHGLAWNATCANAAVGSSCTTACAANASGPGFVASCHDGNYTLPPVNITGNTTPPFPLVYGSWSITGSCALRVCSGLPTATQPAFSNGWNTSCANGTVGTTCEASCATTNVTGAGYTAVCNQNGNWTLSGGCGLKNCTGLPPTSDLKLQAGPWNASCANASVGETCSLGCTSNSTGGYMAFCNDGNWTVSGTCALSICQGLPTPVSPQYSTGWNASCDGAAVGSTCQAPCATANVTGTPYVSQCSVNGTWTAPASGSCKLKTCPTLPPTAGLQLQAGSWNASCANATVGDTCSLGCVANATGGYTAFCNDGAWTTSGECKLITCPGLPSASKALISSWNASCAGLQHGSTCRAECADNARGFYSATCNLGTWADDLSSTCTLKTCPELPPEQSYAASAWSASCANAAVGSAACSIACAATNYTGSGWTATCVNNPNATVGTWQIGGICEPKKCASPPPAQVLSVGWDAGCFNKTALDTACVSSCLPNATGGGYSAVCIGGNWVVSGSDCQLKQCPAQPSDVVANAASWNCSSTAVSAFWGDTCTAQCKEDSWGVPQIMECKDGWQVKQTGSCTVKKCPYLPPKSDNNSLDWNTGCTGNLVGDKCYADCKEGSNGAYQAECVVQQGSPSWAVWGQCTVTTCPSAPGTPQGAGPWSPGCTAGATWGTKCSANCSTYNASGIGYSTECRNGVWAIWGSCSLRSCAGYPMNTQVPASTSGWYLGNGVECTNQGIDTVCTATCSSNTTTGGALTAKCVPDPNSSAGMWTVVGSVTCTAKTCASNPAGDIANSQGWVNCIGKGLEGTCTSPCNIDAFGVNGGYVARCVDQNQWEKYGTCERKCLESAKEAAPLNSTGWLDNCINTRFNTNCTAPCKIGLSGTGYTIPCQSDGSWGNITGSCS